MVTAWSLAGRRCLLSYTLTLLLWNKSWLVYLSYNRRVIAPWLEGAGICWYLLTGCYGKLYQTLLINLQPRRLFDMGASSGWIPLQCLLLTVAEPRWSCVHVWNRVGHEQGGDICWLWVKTEIPGLFNRSWSEMLQVEDAVHVRAKVLTISTTLDCFHY